MSLAHEIEGAQSHGSGNDEGFADLAAWLAALQFYDEPPSNACGERQVVLGQVHFVTSLAHHRAKARGIVAFCWRI